MTNIPFSFSCLNNSRGGFLYHLTINTGHLVRHDLSLVQRLSPLDLLPLKTRCAEIPGMPGFAYAVTPSTNCCQLVLAHRGDEMITGGLAWAPGDGHSLWAWLQDYYDYTVSKIPAWQPFCPSKPPGMPWLAVVISPNHRFITDEEQRLLGGFESILALAVIRASLEQN